MRRANHLFERIVERENLRLAVHKALRGKRSKADARAFVARLDENLEAMRHRWLLRERRSRGVTPVHDLRPQGAADHGPVLPRTGAAPRDHERLRAGLRALADRRHVRLPQGQGPARRPRAGGTFSRRFPFFLKLDIRKYFDSISHAILLARLRAAVQGSAACSSLFSGSSRLTRRQPAGPADRQPDVAALRELLPGRLRPVRQGGPPRSGATSGTWTTVPCGRTTAAMLRRPPRRRPRLPGRRAGLELKPSLHQPHGARDGLSWAAAFPRPPDAESPQPRPVPAEADGAGSSVPRWSDRRA